MTRKNHKKLHIRALSLLLVMVNLLSLVPLSTHSEENSESLVQSAEASFVIALDGAPASQMTICSFDKKEINVEGNVAADDYQWQILHPKKDDLWINIYDATAGYLPVTLALVKNMLDEDNTAQLRCRVQAEGAAHYTSAMTVHFNKEDDGIPTVLADLAIPEETVPETTIPEETVPETTIPEETVPETTIPEETVPETTIPEETVPETTIPEETVPETTIPEETVPETTIPEEIVPEVTASEETVSVPVVLAAVVPETTIPEEIVPEVTASEETVSVPVVLAAVVPETNIPEETVPETTVPEETVPAETEAEAPVLSAVVEEVVDAAPAMAAPATENVDTPEPVDEGTDDTQSKEYVTVTIKYMRYDYAKDADGKLIVDANDKPILSTTGVMVFTSHEEQLQYGLTYETTTIPSPALVGYDRYLGDSEVAGSGNSVTISEQIVTEDITIEVKYKPANVDYGVRYYFQNIYDDQYIEDAAIKASVKDQGKTGSIPPQTILKPDIPGFTCLYYEPETIAADGGTVFASYFERNYYLMEFDCDGGYGAETLYVRYGTYISVPNPVKSGYVFRHWDLEQKDKVDANGNQLRDEETGKILVETEPDENENILPTEMPSYNSAYVAIWGTDITTYTVAYWLKNGDEITYLGNYLESAETGSPAVGTDNLGHTGLGAVCGLYGHEHNVNCFKCKNLTHEHVETCFSCGKVNHTHTKADCYAGNPEKHGAELTATTGDTAGWNAILQVNEGLVDPTETYLYFTGAKGSDTYWPKMFVDGKLFQVKLDGKESINVADLANYVDGECINSITYNSDFAVKYRIKMTCGKPEHSHTEACSECGTHEHTLDCRQDSHYLDYLEDETIKANEGKIVEGDGSTVVNVYYSYKTYTLRYYYAKRMNNEEVKDENGNAVTDENGNKVKGVFYVVGGTTWPFGGYNIDASESKTVIELLGNVSDWGDVKSEPKIKSEYLTGDTKRYDTGTVTTNDGSITYYYLEYNAIYGQDLENLWPVDIFEPVEIKGSHPNRPGLKYAYFSAWNGEACTKYSTDVRDKNLHGGNYTIKGLYMQLDEHIIFDRKYSIKAETTLVSYLGFWENGDNTGWSNPKKFQYHIMKKSTDKENVPGKTYKTYNETKYELYKDFTVYDNNNLSEYWHQTAVGLPGYTNVGVEFDNASYDQNYNRDNPILQSVDYYFYYDPTIHTITFWNHSEYLGEGTGSSIAYGTNLKKYGAYAEGMVYDAQNNKKGKYPSSLEPGAYQFDGWYTTAQCIPGTEMNWDQEMPDSDFVVYAKWSPVTRNVKFHLTYEDMVKEKTWDEMTKTDGTPVTYPIVVEHGAELGTTYAVTPTRKEVVDGKEVNYRFVGWFYMDENNKKRFAPDTMRVTRDLNLFAEWSTIVDTTYEVRYVLRDAVEAHQASGGPYNAGDPVADPTVGHATVGMTKTFSAKAQDKLYAAFQENFFPEISSQSILMDLDGTKNVKTFKYVYDPLVYYKVRYVDKVTQTELVPSVICETQKAVVTEKFLPITGYIPENYYITKTLMSDGTAAEPIEENIITFYYIENPTEGVYSIEYYLENEDSDDPDDPSNYHQHDAEIGTITLDPNTKKAMKTANYRSYDGYECVTAMNTVINYEVQKHANGDIAYDENGKPIIKEITKTGEDAGNPPKGYVDEGGLTIRIYYKRRTYSFDIEYREYGTGADAKALVTKLYNPEKPNEAKLGEEISWSLVDGTRDDRTIKVNGKTYGYYIPDLEANDPELTKSMKISHFNSGDANPNKLTFYFVQKQVEVQYHKVCSVPVTEDTAFGYVSLNKESGTAPENLKGATATAADGFLFKGWYSDEACKNSVSANAEFRPTTLSEDLGWVHKYYALFEPVKKDLKIVKSGSDLGDDTFLFRITGTDATGHNVNMVVSIQGAGSVTVKNLYCGNYTVTELMDWSWAYTADSQAEVSQNVSITADGDNGEVTFTNSAKSVDWLHGETRKENQFKK